MGDKMAQALAISGREARTLYNSYVRHMESNGDPNAFFKRHMASQNTQKSVLDVLGETYRGRKGKKLFSLFSWRHTRALAESINGSAGSDILFILKRNNGRPLVKEGDIEWATSRQKRHGEHGLALQD